jgi:DNA-binding response OmpR family regulator
MNNKVLIIDDDPDHVKLVEVILTSLGMSVYIAHSGSEGLKKAYLMHPDLVLLDINMPGLNGFEVCSRLREISNVSIMILSARINENDVLHGFNVGATDYLKKPFVKSELEARVRALIRRSSEQSFDRSTYITSYKDPYLDIDLSNKLIKLNGEIINLSPREFDLLAYLVNEQGKIVSQLELVREAWGNLSINDLSEVSLYIHYLRRKLKDGQYGHEYIRTFWGRGYWFEPMKNIELP